MCGPPDTLCEMVASTDGREIMIDALPEETRDHQAQYELSSQLLVLAVWVSPTTVFNES